MQYYNRVTSIINSEISLDMADPDVTTYPNYVLYADITLKISKLRILCAKRSIIHPDQINIYGYHNGEIYKTKIYASSGETIKGCEPRLYSTANVLGDAVIFVYHGVQTIYCLKTNKYVRSTLGYVVSDVKLYTNFVIVTLPSNLKILFHYGVNDEHASRYVYLDNVENHLELA
jgi:hypothetical protein